MDYSPSMKTPSSQSGAVLFTALVMMVLMTLLAVTMMGNTAIDEKMAQNSEDKNRAFQGAETGIELAIADPNSINTSCGFDGAGNNTCSSTNVTTLNAATTGNNFNIDVTYTSNFLQKTPVSRGSGFDSSFANYWFEINSQAQTSTGASSSVALGMFQVGAN